jgi:hypothetical protein
MRRLPAHALVPGSLLLLGCLALGCAPSGPRSATRPSLQTREFQTRSYATKDTGMVMKALVNVLQDEGFIIKVANNDLGLITATSEHTERHWYFIFAKDFTYSRTCSVNITPFGEQTKVRVNVQISVKTWPSGSESVSGIDDPTYYRDFFAKVDKGIFIQRERL